MSSAALAGCSTCGAPGVVADSCKACGALALEQPQQALATVLLVRAADTVARVAGAALAEHHFETIHATTGERALAVLSRMPVQVAVVDVGLEGFGAFALLEELQKRVPNERPKSILVASVFNKAAYKRRPTSLYGADDYVEQHHVVDMLPTKVGALLGLAAKDARAKSPVGLKAEQNPTGNERDRARQLAARIVADVALYHQDDVVRAAHGEPSPGLQKALAEGRELLAQVVDPHHYVGEDPILDRFRLLLSEIKHAGPKL